MGAGKCSALRAVFGVTVIAMLSLCESIVMATRKHSYSCAKAQLSHGLTNMPVYSSTNWSLPTEHNGHTQSSGRSSKAVPGSIPFSGSPTAGSYTYPQTSHTYFFIGVFYRLNIWRKGNTYSCIFKNLTVSFHIFFGLLGVS